MARRIGLATDQVQYPTADRPSYGKVEIRELPVRMTDFPGYSTVLVLVEH